MSLSLCPKKLDHDNENWFESLTQAREVIAIWRQDYNEVRPHGTIGRILRLSLPPSTASQTHQPPTQDQLTCKPLDLSPTDWYGWRGQVICKVCIRATAKNNP